ncbi:3-dehydroquinate synthase [Anaerosolibacter sp.]|uniref:3-dehydroquinate synthase n=1 Tax=Anaerosolibacter sp. TaxID=1872527 RepID=UPI0039F0D063
MEKVQINLGEKSYDILIGKNLLKCLPNLIGTNGEKGFIITDENVDALYGNQINVLHNYHKITLAPGEKSKSMDTTMDILSQMLREGLSRKSWIIAFGGGVVGDLAGFCSSIYMRGIPFIQIPTTLLAQIDSSVGGKTGVNLSDYKNSIGTFYQPRQVIIDTEFLHTLPYRELLSGIGEMIKYGIIYDHTFFQYIVKEIDQIKALDNEIMAYAIKRCCEIKAEVVSQDEKEEGLRKILNFGHTLGHALEGLTHFSTYTHGEAVIIGMYYETLIAKRLGIISQQYSREIEIFLESLGVDLDIAAYPLSKLIDWMSRDKKNSHGKISFILPISEGKVSELLLDSDEIYW